MNKEKFLQKPMNRLGLGKCFNRYFFDESSTKYLVNNELRYMKQSDVLSLEDFFELNSSLGRKINFLITRKKSFQPQKNSLSIKTTSFLKLKNLLEKKGFDRDDWLWLAEKKLSIEDLPKEKILNYSIIEILGSYRSCLPMKTIAEFFSLAPEEILVKDLMSLDDSDALLMPAALLTLQAAQRRLRRYGFNDGDGQFMRASLDLFIKNNKRLF